MSAHAITATYDPSSNTISCSPHQVHAPIHETSTITISLALSSGSTGSLAFQATPIDWPHGKPDRVTVGTPNGPQITLTADNENPPEVEENRLFHINITYTPVNGSPVNKTGDPTIILEGT